MLVPFNRYRYILKGVWRIQGINLLGVDLCLVSALRLKLRIYDTCILRAPINMYLYLLIGTIIKYK
jgi:hypothetical protein